MSEDRCVICGAYVPEGRMICPNCEAGKKALINDGGFHKPIIFEPTITKDECPMCKRSFKDFVKVVRCKDCKWSNDDCSECMNPNLALGGDYASCLYIDPNWFCADGERKKGKWEVCGTFDDFLKCSCCGYKKPWNDDVFDFCPKCGAEMEETDAEVR